MKKVRVEMIESYWKVEDSDYQWNDNHGILIRCRDCKYYRFTEDSDNNCIRWEGLVECLPESYCSWAERKEE